MKDVGEPCARKPHARFDGGRWRRRHDALRRRAEPPLGNHGISAAGPTAHQLAAPALYPTNFFSTMQELVRMREFLGQR